MNWQLSDRADPVAARIADRHYNRQKIGSPQFAPPGRCLVLRTDPGDAFWISSWPFTEHVGYTKRGLVALLLTPERMPAAREPGNWQSALDAA